MGGKQATRRDDKPGTRALKELCARLMTPDPQLKPILDAAQAAIGCLAASDGEGAVAHTVDAFHRLMVKQAQALQELAEKSHLVGSHPYARAYWQVWTQIDETRKAIAASGELRDKVLAEFDRLRGDGYNVGYSQEQAAVKYHVGVRSIERWRGERKKSESAKPV